MTESSVYFSLTKAERARRFARRHDDTLRQWKLLPAPWTIIRSGGKQRARLNARMVILNAVDYPDRNLDLDRVPDRKVVVTGAEEIALMEAERIRKGRFTG